MSTRTTLTAGIAALIALSACGSDTTSEPGTTEPGATESGTVEPSDGLDLDEIRAELDALEFESETIDGVSVLGNAPLADDGADEAGELDPSLTDPDPGLTDPDPELAVDCPEDDECPELDEIYGEEESVEPDSTEQTQPDVLEEPPSFVPTDDWAPFCTVLAELEDRPFPTDDAEALRTVDVWFRLLEPHVPSILVEPFGVLDDALDVAVEAGDPSIMDSLSDDLDAAAERMGRGVDAGCSGRGSLDDLD